MEYSYINQTTELHHYTFVATELDAFGSNSKMN